MGGVVVVVLTLTRINHQVFAPKAHPCLAILTILLCCGRRRMHRGETGGLGGGA